MTATWEEDHEELRRLFEGPHKKESTDPNLVEDLAYRMRFAANGVVWHSWVDPNRPDSPPVEWPEYPKDERPADIPEDGIMAHRTDPQVIAAAKQRGSYKENPIKPLKSLIEPCAVGNVAPIENPDEAEDYLESLQNPTFPGIYPGSANPKWSGGGGPGLPGYNDDIDTEDDYEF